MSKIKNMMIEQIADDEEAMIAEDAEMSALRATFFEYCDSHVSSLRMPRIRLLKELTYEHKLLNEEE